MQLVITVDLDNDAFQHNNLSEELYSILNDYLRKLDQSGYVNQNMVDSNGNVVAKAVEKEEEFNSDWDA